MIWVFHVLLLCLNNDLFCGLFYPIWRQIIYMWSCLIFGFDNMLLFGSPASVLISNTIFALSFIFGSVMIWHKFCFSLPRE